MNKPPITPRPSGGMQPYSRKEEIMDLVFIYGSIALVIGFSLFLVFIMLTNH